MEIKPHIKEGHERLSKYNILFHDFVRQKPESLRASSYGLLELNDPLFKLQPWPTFIGQKIKAEIIEANLKVLNLLKIIPQRVFANDPGKTSKYYGVSLDLAKYFLYGVNNEHLDNLLARGDFIITSTGLKCLEYNVNTNLGGMSLPLWESLYQATPIISEFLKQYRVKIQNRNLYSFMFEHLAKAAVKFYRGCDKINIAIVMPIGYNDPRKASQERYMNTVLNSVLPTVFNRPDGQVILCTYSQLKKSGDNVYYDSKKVHIIVEWCQGYIPHDILELFNERKILICNGAIAWILSTKLNLALLSESKDSGWFTAEEKETIEKYIPWTRKVTDGRTTYKGETIQLKEFILANREKLVLKPLIGAGGKDIHVGPHTPEKEWRDVVESAMHWNDWQDIHFDENLTEEKWYEVVKTAYDVKNWLVQEYIEPSTYMYQLGENGYGEHHAVWGFFIFGDTYSGGWVRAMPTNSKSGIINCHQGAKVSVVFEVEE
ncbi:MAG: hypothetical protein QG657_5766 [Acidobacteriota bacterium]|nr:hypothetical protein [Acidobacteriota bacterium]